MASVIRFDNWQTTDGTSIATTNASGDITFAGSLSHGNTSFAGSRNGGHVSAGNVVVLDAVQHNTGSAYNTTTGVFTCPQNGLYLVCMTGIANSSSNVVWELTKNVSSGWTLGGGLLTPRNDDAPTTYGQASGSGVFSFTQGDELRFVVTRGELYGAAANWTNGSITLLG